MTYRHTLGTGLLLLFAAMVEGLLRSEPEKDERDAKIARLIDRLGDDDFDTREKTNRALQDVGEPALPALRLASRKNPDAEIRRRAELAIAGILLDARKSKSLGLEMVVLDPAEYPMGSPKNESYRRPDELQHRVRLTKPFLIGTFEVTQEQYEKVMGRNPSWFSKDGNGKAAVAKIDTARLPVEQVTWYDAVEFCNKLSARDGYPAYYKLADVRRDGDVTTYATVTIAGGSGYRLPTEAEWEYACRAGSTTRFHFGYSSEGREANLKPGPAVGYGAAPTWPTADRPVPVGSYKPNDWGLHEMHGNVAEWCQDWYHADYYANSPADDPPGPNSGEHRALRGGSWLISEINCRSASRAFLRQDEKAYYAGFRVARTP